MIRFKLAWVTLGLLAFLSDGLAGRPEYDCSKLEAIAHEMIEAEFSGVRYQVGVSPCLDQGRFKTIQIRHQSVGDAYLLKPEKLLAKGAHFKLEGVKREEGDVVQASFSYTTTDGKKIHDDLVFVLNFGGKARRRGCAQIYREPNIFSMRTECLIDPAKANATK